MNMVRAPVCSVEPLFYIVHTLQILARLTHERDQVEKVPNLNGSEARKESNYMRGNDLQ